MTLPREVIAGRFYMVTRRCRQRLFLLRPDVNQLVAKSPNALRGRWENLWSSEQVCVVWLVDPAE
jgi:hypothetical protein